MKVLHLIAPIHFGGGESLLVNLLKAKETGIDESVCSIYKSLPFEQHLNALGVPHMGLRKKTIGSGMGRLQIGLDTVVTLLFLPKLVRWIGKENFSVVHAHGFPASFLFFIIYPFVRAKGVYTHHSFRKKPVWLERFLFTKIYNAFGALTAVSQAACQSMASAFPDVKRSWDTVYNCIGEQFYSCVSRTEEKQCEGRRLRFVQVGRFSTYKNQDLVVRSLMRLTPAQREKIQVVFIGDGPERFKIESLVQQNRLCASVIFLGKRPYETIHEILGKADFGLFPSENEGFGIGAVECLAVGLPVVTLTSDLMNEIVGDAGIQVEKQAFHTGLVAMMEHGDALRQNAVEKASFFRSGYIKTQYVAIYNRVSCGKGY